MWMMGCTDGADFSIPDSFNGRKLRPLMPRTPMAPSSPPRLTRLPGTDIFSLNHHLADQSKRDFQTQQVVVSSRWNPTPEQLRTLEELYRRGTRTPSTEQIQHITAQLRRYGKIEGKNVFYWFQNHKARERQKRRRQMESAMNSDNEQQQQSQQQQHQQLDNESGGNEQIKNWVLSTNCSTLPEESIPTQRAAAAGKGGNNNNVTECREGWYQLDEMEFQNRKNFIERNATWQQMMQLSSPSLSSTHLINTTSAPLCNVSTTSTTSPISQTLTATKTNSTATMRTMDPMLIKANTFIAPHYYTPNSHLFNQQQQDELENNSHQTLQLFPINTINEGGKQSINDKDDHTETSFASINNANSAPSQFFEFLPVKN